MTKEGLLKFVGYFWGPMGRINTAGSVQKHGLVLISQTWGRGDLLTMLTLVISLGVGYPVQAMSEGPSGVEQDIWLLTGEILDIQGDSYTVEDGNGHEYRILVDKSTQVPQSVEPGDMVHIEVDATNHARSVKRFGLIQFNEEFDRRLLKTEAWLKNDTKVGAAELRKVARLLKAEADRGDEETRKALRKSMSEFETLADDVTHEVHHSVADVESAFARVRAALSKRVHEKTLR